MSQRFIKWEHSHSLWFYAHASCLPANSLYYTVLFWWEKKHTFWRASQCEQLFQKIWLRWCSSLFTAQQLSVLLLLSSRLNMFGSKENIYLFMYFMASTEVSCDHKVPLFFVCPVFNNFVLYFITCSSSKTTFYSSIVCIGLHSGVFVI